MPNCSKILLLQIQNLSSMTCQFHRKFFCCLSLTNYLFSKLRLPYIGVISAIVKMLTKYLIFVLIQISFSIGQNWEKKALIVEQTAAEFFKSSSEISDRNFIHKSSHLSLIITNYSTIGPVLYQTTISGIHDSLNLSNCWCCLLLWKNSDR